MFYNQDNRTFINKMFLFQTLLFIFVLVVNLYYPLMVDDLARLNNGLFEHLQGNWYKHSIRPLNHTLRNDYQVWTGRMSAQALVYIAFNRFYIVYSYVITAIITAGAYVLFTKCLYDISYPQQIIKRNQDNTVTSRVFYALCLFAYLLIIKDFKEVCLYRTVAIQYFWGMVIMLYIFNKLELIKNMASNDSSNIYSLMKSTISSLLLLALGFLLGLYNEILTAIFIILLLIKLWAFTNYRFDNVLDIIKSKGLMLFLSGLFIGFGIMMQSPGTQSRKLRAISLVHDKIASYSISDKLVFPFIHYYDVEAKRYISTAVVAMLLICCFKLYYFRNQSIYHELSRNFRIIVFLIIGYILSLLLLSSFAYYYEEQIIGRVTIVSDLIMFILLFRLLDFCNIFDWKLIQRIMIMICALSPLYFITAVYASSIEYKYNQDRIFLIQNTVDHIHKDFNFLDFRCDTNILNIWRKLSVSDSAFTDDASFWANTDYATTYSTKSVKKSCY